MNRRFDKIYWSEPIFTDPYVGFQIKDTNARTHREMYRTHKQTPDKCMEKLQSSLENYVLNVEYQRSNRKIHSKYTKGNHFIKPYEKKKGVGVGVGVLKTIHPMGEELS